MKKIFKDGKCDNAIWSKSRHDWFSLLNIGDPVKFGLYRHTMPKLVNKCSSMPRMSGNVKTVTFGATSFQSVNVLATTDVKREALTAVKVCSDNI